MRELIQLGACVVLGWCVQEVFWPWDFLGRCRCGACRAVRELKDEEEVRR